MYALWFLLIISFISIALYHSYKWGYDKGYNHGYDDGDEEGYKCGLADANRQFQNMCDEVINKKEYETD